MENQPSHIYDQLVESLESHLKKLQSEKVFGFQKALFSTPLEQKPAAKVVQAITPAAAPVALDTIEKKPLVSLAAPLKIEKESMQDIKKTMERLFPKIAIKMAIPSDARAKNIKQSWKYKSLFSDITILHSEQDEPLFLQNVAKALTDHFFETKLFSVEQIEKNHLYDDLFASPKIKLILCTKKTLFQNKRLASCYKEESSNPLSKLALHPLILLEETAAYTNPSLKRSLWTLLCQILRPLKS